MIRFDRANVLSSLSIQWSQWRLAIQNRPSRRLRRLRFVSRLRLWSLEACLCLGFRLRR